MSNPIIDPQVEEQSRPLFHSGQVWRERLVEEQLPLARQMAMLLTSVSTSHAFYEAGSWLDGKEGVPQLYPWRFLPSDVLVQGPAYWGYDVEGKPRFGEPTLDDLSRSRAYLMADGRVVESRAGDATSIPAPADLSPQTVWFLPLPEGFRPVSLVSLVGTLLEGSGFICAGNWILLYQNPLELWPNGIAVATCVRTKASWKSTTLRANRLHTSGRDLALYRRNSQNLKQFERALCEVAGIRVLDQDGLVVRMETGNNVIIHWLDDGRSFTLPVASPYTTGALVPAGSGHILSLRHQGLQGDLWWQGRPWGSRGIPIFEFRPGFYGFSLKDETVGAFAMADSFALSGIAFSGESLVYGETPFVYSGDPIGLRARLALEQDAEAEDAFWLWQADQERRLGAETFARDVLGFTESGETKPVNALGVFAGIYGPWLAVVETSLDEVDPIAFQEVSDYIERERPAGMQVFLAGTSLSFSSPEFYAVYLNTGELVEHTTDTILAMPPAH